MSPRNPNPHRGGSSPNARNRAVLAAIIQGHLVTGEPVGSRVIAEHYAHAAGWSSATIRNIMGELEEAGLVEQPHTSAGRVPTDKGYRFYVDHLLNQAELDQTDRATLDKFLEISLVEGTRSPEWLMERASQALSALSDNVGIVISPSPSNSRLQHVEFFKMSGQRILVVLVFAPNLVQHKVIRFEGDISQAELERTARYLNNEFCGKNLRAIRTELIELMRVEKALYDKLLRNAILLCESSLADEAGGAGEVFLDGAYNMLGKPDFNDTQQMRELFRTFEEKSRLVHILNECIAQDYSLMGAVHVIIGRENVTPAMQQCAIITTPYRLSPEDSYAYGALGVVGPVRIEYARMMAVVQYTARLLERVLWAESPAAKST